MGKRTFRPRSVGFLSLLLLGAMLFAFPSSSAAQGSIPPDDPGRDALRLWAERERERDYKEQERRYIDYRLFCERSRRFSSERLGRDLDRTMLWLKDGDGTPAQAFRFTPYGCRPYWYGATGSYPPCDACDPASLYRPLPRRLPAGGGRGHR